jgi:hypothetical protein
MPDDHSIRDTETFRELVELSPIRTVPKHMDVCVRYFTHNVRQSLNDPLVALIPLKTATRHNPAGNGDRPHRSRWQRAAIADYSDLLVSQTCLLRQHLGLEATYPNK